MAWRYDNRVKVLVLGAGVIGVTSAWYLAQAGHEVTVAERHGEAGMETSFANGGQISASHPEPRAKLAGVPKILRWLRGGGAAPPLRPPARLALWGRGLPLLLECLPR